MSLRQRVHDWSLLFFAALGSYLLWLILASRGGVWLVEVLGPSASAAVRVLLAALALDLSKLVVLVPGVLLLGALTALGPLARAVGLTLLLYALELIVALLSGQLLGLFWGVPILLCRAAGAAVNVAVLYQVARRRQPRRAQEAATSPKSAPPAADPAPPPEADRR